MKAPVVDGLVILLAGGTGFECGHAGSAAVVRLPGHNAVARPAMATAGKRVEIIAAGGIENVADASRAHGYVREHKGGLLVVSLAGFNPKIIKACQRQWGCG